MTRAEARYVTQEQQPELLFSVCTLVASDEKYARMLASFEKYGFTAANSEFIALDNRGENRFDGYSVLRRMFPEFRGKYIILVHDDVELIDDGAPELIDILEGLDSRAPDWTVAGCAGWSADGKHLLRHMQDPHGWSRDLTEAVEAQSLDECFLVLPRARPVLPSIDLSGFHMFAADMCIQSRLAGGRAFVLPFFLHHHGAGTPSAALDACREAFVRKYQSLRIGTRMRAPAVTVYFGLLGGIHKTLDSVAASIRGKMEAVARRASASTK